MIRKYNIDKYKKKSLKLMMGILLGSTILGTTGCANDVNYEEEIEASEEIEPAVYELPMEDQLKTRGALEIYFENTNYIDKFNTTLNNYTDGLLFYNIDGESYGIVLSSEKSFVTTFPVGDYKFYSDYLDIEGEFTITEPGEYQVLEIDYETKTYNIYPKTEKTHTR